jgi:hypothetical protein
MMNDKSNKLPTSLEVVRYIVTYRTSTWYDCLVRLTLTEEAWRSRVFSRSYPKLGIAARESGSA